MLTVTSLPNEILLLIAHLLCYPDLRRLRLVCRRLWNVTAVVPGVKPVNLHVPDLEIVEFTDFISDCEAERARELKDARAVRCNTENGISFSHIYGQDREVVRLFCQMTEVECLSLGPSKIFQLLLERLHSVSYFASLTHLKCDFHIQFWPFRNVHQSPIFPALVDVTLCPTERTYASFYSIREAERIVRWLSSCQIVSFAISLVDDALQLLPLATNSWPTLRTLSLCSQSVLQMLFVPKGYPEDGEENCIASLPVHPRLEHLALTNCPIAGIHISSNSDGRIVGAGEMLIPMSSNGVIRNHREIYDSDVVRATKALGLIYPRLTLAGWLIPYSGTRKKAQVWCRRPESDGARETDWECIVGQNCWPKTDMDFVFSG